MEEEKKTRVRRSKDQLIAEQEQKLKEENERHEKTVNAIKTRIEKLKTPPAPKLTRKQKEERVMAALLEKYGNLEMLADKALGQTVAEVIEEDKPARKRGGKKEE